MRTKTRHPFWHTCMSTKAFAPSPADEAASVPVVRRCPTLGWPGDIADLPRVVDADNAAGPAFPPLSHPIGLYAVVGSADWVQRCVELGLDSVQLRVKDLPAPALRRAVEQSVAATAGSNTRLFVNDFWREAIDAGAYGVHLGQEDLTDAGLPAIASAGVRLGISTHSYFEIARAHAVAPSYVAIGPIYATTTKPMKFAPQGIPRLERWVELLRDRYPLTAIGGVDVERAPRRDGHRRRQHRGGTRHHRVARSRPGGCRSTRRDAARSRPRTLTTVAIRRAESYPARGLARLASTRGVQSVRGAVPKDATQLQTLTAAQGV